MATALTDGILELRRIFLMRRCHIFEYSPIFVGGKIRYILELPVYEKPILFKTMTTDMKTWFGEVKSVYKKGELTLATIETQQGILLARVVSCVTVYGPCWVMEHLNVDGHMELLVASERLLRDNQNFVNFGLPQGKHVRIDIYTGEHRIINNG